MAGIWDLIQDREHPPPSTGRPSQTPPLDRQNVQSPERRPYTGYTSALGESWDVDSGGDLKRKKRMILSMKMTKRLQTA